MKSLTFLIFMIPLIAIGQWEKQYEFDKQVMGPISTFEGDQYYYRHSINDNTILIHNYESFEVLFEVPLSHEPKNSNTITVFGKGFYTGGSELEFIVLARNFSGEIDSYIYNEKGELLETLEGMYCYPQAIDRIACSESYNVNNRLTKSIYKPVKDLSTALIEEEEEGFIIYPNPTNGMVNVPNGTIEVYSMEGRKVDTADIRDNKYDASGLSPGAYVVRSDMGTFRMVRK